MVNLLAELKRRNVFRVAIAYLVFGWLVLQVADVLFPALHLPASSITLTAVLLAIGFIPAMAFAWAYELTPEGLKHESKIDRSQSVGKDTARRLDLITITMVLLAAVALVAQRLSVQPGSETQPLSAPHEYSIAVMPFDDLSDTQDQTYFSDGLAEELLNRLAKVKGFRVAGRTSSFAFRDRPDDLRVIGEKLNVAAILEGSVRKSGEQLRITAQLINVADGYHLWSETYDRHLENIFEIQDEIAFAVVRELQATLMGASRAIEVPAATVTDNRAYELYLRGRHQLWTRRAEPLREAQSLFEQAIRIDRGYAPAYAGLSDSLVFQVVQGYAEESPSFAAAAKAVDEALRIDAGNPEILASLGLLRRQQGRTQAARDALRPAIALNPNNAQAHIWLSNTYAIDDPPEALRLAQKAYAVDPLARLVIVGNAYRLMDYGRSSEAIGLARAMHAQYPESGWGYEIAGDAHFRAGRIDAALKSYFLAYRTAPDRASGFASVGFVLLELGADDIAETWASELEQVGPEHRYLLWLRAQLGLARDDPDYAAQVFEAAAARRTDPWFDHQAGIVLMLSGDYLDARKVMERGLLLPGLGRPVFDRERWPDFIDYAYVLQRTGSPDDASALMGEAQAILDEQLHSGIVRVGYFPFDLHGLAALLQLMSGHAGEALTELRRSARRGGLSCLWCLQNYPQLDSLREDPGFISLLEQEKSRRDALRRQLADEGLLMTPEEVRSAADFGFDPFGA